MSDLTDRCEQQAEMIQCHGFKATHNLLLDCAAEIERLERQKLDDDAFIIGMDFRIAELEAERDEYKSRWEQTGCTRHTAMETAIALANKRLAEIKRLRAALENIANGYIPDVDYDSTSESLSSLMSGYARHVLNDGGVNDDV